jgi:hypothetical protein
MLSSGWSASRVHQHIKLVYRVMVPLVDIKAYRELIPSEAMLPPVPLKEQFQDIDIEIDAVGEMGRLLRLSAERLQDALLVEELTEERVPYLDTAVKVYWKMLREYVETKQTLGVLPIAEKAVEVSVTAPPQQTQLTLRQILVMKPADEPEKIVDSNYKRLGDK